MSAYLYHRVPENFRGNIIYPLSKLKEVHPDIYSEKVENYSWRPQVMEQPVYPLNCLWNDCIFLVATPPGEIKHKMQEIDPNSRFPSRFWKIDPHALEPSNATIYTFEHDFRPHPPEDFVPYDPNDLERWATVPEKTEEYWRQCFEEKNPRMLLYVYIPHILYKGQIDISNAVIVEV